MDNPWRQKEIIDTALSMVEREGFRVDRSHHYSDKICLYTQGANEHGFANDIVLEAFTDWADVIAFMTGWRKHDLAMQLGKVAKKTQQHGK